MKSVSPEPIRFGAPWGASVRIITLCGCAALLGVAWLVHSRGSGTFPILLPIAVLGFCALTGVTGYVITPAELVILRPFGRTRIARAEITRAEAHPNAMAGSLRTFGTGGLFAFTGRFYNKSLGAYRAWVTDSARTVVIRQGERILVVSPADPDAFVAALRQAQQQQ